MSRCFVDSIAVETRHMQRITHVVRNREFRRYNGVGSLSRASNDERAGSVGIVPPGSPVRIE